MSKDRNYSTYSQRLESYQGWPRRYFEQTPESLAAAGFFYIGSADRVTCYDCHETVRNWQRGQDPITRHKQVSPDCNFIKSITSSEVDKDRESSNLALRYHFPEGSDCDSAPKHMMAIGQMDVPIDRIKSVYQRSVEGYFSPDVEDVVTYVRHNLHIGFIRHDDKTANTTTKTKTATTTTKRGQTSADENRDNSKEPVKSSDTKQEAVDNSVSENRQTLSSENAKESHDGSKDLVLRLRKENVILKNQRLCKICCRNEATILVLPCSHIVFCSECVDMQIVCSKCKAKILGTVKVFLA